jgi:butyrate kinase
MKRILVINVGSTSIKAGVFLDGAPIFKETVGAVGMLEGISEGLSFCRKVLEDILDRYSAFREGIDLIVSRGGLSRPLKGGAYEINEAMCKDLREARFGWHPSNLGPLLAYELGQRMGVRAIIFDSPATDEMEPIAKVSGLKGIERKAAFHVLSQKAAGRRAAREFKRSYEEMNLVIAHLGGGITICAHREGRIIDGTHGLSEGPFTPQRSGALPLEDVIGLCFSGRFKGGEELKAYLIGKGGLVSYLGTYEIPRIEARIRSGDKEAELILRAMCYQVGKEIGAMAVVLRGRVDAVVLTGNLCYSEFIVEEIKSLVKFLAPVLVFSGEDELESLALGGLEVLSSGGPSFVNEY